MSGLDILGNWSLVDNNSYVSINVVISTMGEKRFDGEGENKSAPNPTVTL